MIDSAIPYSLLLGAFVSPGLAAAGAGAVAAPILIHLLARRRFRRIRWAAMDFLIDAERRNRRRLRMEEWILLALRCLAVLLIGLCLARPFLRPSGAAALLGGSRRTERVFVLDDSLSLGYESPSGTAFSQAKVAVRRLLDSIRRETPDDTASILRMTAPDAPVESGTYLNDAQTEALLQRVEALSPTQRTADPARSMEAVAEMLDRTGDVTNAAIYVLSDFQRTNWIGEAAGDIGHSADGGLFEPLTAWAGTERGLRIVLVHVGEEFRPNAAVTEVSIEGGRIVAGSTGRIRAQLANYAPRTLEDVEVGVAVGNVAQASERVRELAPRQSANVRLEAEFFRSGYESFRVFLRGDALPADDSRYGVVRVAPAVRVLVVNGEPSSDSFDDEVTFLATALRPEGEVFSGNEVVIVDEAELEETNIEQFAALVLANVYHVSEPMIERMEAFVRRGGGLLIFLGDQVDAELYNASLYRMGEGFLPAELGEIVRPPEAAHLVVVDRLNPAMRGLGSEGDPLGISQVPFFQFFACKPFRSEGATGEDNGSPPIGSAENDGLRDAPSPSSKDLRSSESDDSFERSATAAARVIARFDDADEHPAIVERPFGRGNAILVTTTADKEWHLWPDHPTFLPVMLELVQEAGRGRSADAGSLVGEPILMSLDSNAYEPDVIVRSPGYPDEREVSVTAVPSEDGSGASLRWEQTDTAGIYQFILKSRTGDEALRLQAVNCDPRESDLTPASAEELRRASGGANVEYVPNLDELTRAADEARTELWRVFLVAALFTLMTEQALAWRWGRKR